jgi:hypothetical protein
MPASPEISDLPSPYRENPDFRASQKVPQFNDEGNRNGYETEQRVGMVLSRLPYVESVRQVEPAGPEDQELVDLVVTMTEGFVIPRTFVQVKSSTVGVRAFYKEVGRRMRRDGTGLDGLVNEDEISHKKKEWMMDRGLIIINGGVNDNEQVTDEYIQDKFFREVQAIVAHRRRQFA